MEPQTKDRKRFVEQIGRGGSMGLRAMPPPQKRKLVAR